MINITTISGSMFGLIINGVSIIANNGVIIGINIGVSTMILGSILVNIGVNNDTNGLLH